MTEVAELRVALTVANFDELADWTSDDGRVVVLSAGRATFELFDEAQAGPASHLPWSGTWRTRR